MPLVKRRMTGQIAGLVGAYGNIGAVTFLTCYSFVDTSQFFMIIAGAALVNFVMVQFIEEPAGHMHEVLPDSTVQLIAIN